MIWTAIAAFIFILTIILFALTISWTKDIDGFINEGQAIREECQKNIDAARQKEG